MLKLLVQQSNCFVVVDRGRWLDAAMQERALNASGELRKTSKMQKGQMVAADYTISPSITFSNRNAGGGAAGGGLGGAYANTAQGKVIVAAFTDSLNNLINAVKQYKAQNVKGGLGNGGACRSTNIGR